MSWYVARSRGCSSFVLLSVTKKKRFFILYKIAWHPFAHVLGFFLLIATTGSDVYPDMQHNGKRANAY